MAGSKFEKFAEFVRAKIRSGEWKPGDQLPTQRQWETGEAGHTIKYGSMRAGYLTLRAEGWITSTQGEGVYVAQKPPCPPYNNPDRAAAVAASRAPTKKTVATKKRT